MASKLELTWVGKDQKIDAEPRILLERESLSYSKEPEGLIQEEGITYDNLLIHGDNLLALKALEKDYAGKVKCVYIDPPYNTGSAFEHYDDNLEHSTWLNLMYERLKLLKKLLKNDGVIFVQIDYNEQAYLKIALDEIFGRQNYLTMITCKVKAPSGIASGANAFFDCSEYILAYAKEKKSFDFNVVKTDSSKVGPSAPTVVNVYNQLITKFQVEKFEDFSTYEDVDIKSLPKDGFSIQTIKKQDRTELNYYNNYQNVFRLAAISGGRDKKILAHVQNLPNYDPEKIYSYSYIASQGKNKGKRITNYIYKGGNILFLKDFVRVDDENRVVYKQDIVTNIFYNDWWQGLTSEGGVSFKNGQKPERLLNLLLSITTSQGDLVLDSFLGSGTTAAAAHKMKRRWIGIEMGDHAYSLCKTRLDSIIDGKDLSGITKMVDWKEGGGYRFYELAPTLIKTDAFGQEIINPEYNPEMLAAAVALHEGYTFSQNPDSYWKQSFNGASSYLFVTTNHVNRQMVDSILTEMKEDEFLLIVAKSFDANCLDGVRNVAIKKISQSLLKNCEFGRDDYSLNIVCPPQYEDEE